MARQQRRALLTVLAFVAGLSLIRVASADELEGTAQVESSGPDAAAPAGSEASFRVHGLLLGAKALVPYQSNEFGFGGAALAVLEWGPSRLWGLQLELGFVGLGGTKQSPPQGLEELRGATGGHVAAGFRVRPFAHTTSAMRQFWLSGAAGVALTGGVAAPLLDAFVGYNFSLTSNFWLGPALGYMLVIQTDKDSPRPENANLLLLGINGSFDFGAAPRNAAPSDRDFDGLIDSKDLCPDEPEDRDGFEDEDGCPDPDNDGDGILDLVDRCPLDPEDLDQFEDEDGCSDPDNDGDKIPDSDDACPLEPEDYDGYQDEDGCPELDNDGDNIPDLKDLCPNEPETVNGIADNDGCPDAESVRVIGDRIELDQKIHFWTNSDVIRGMSYPVLDKLARFLIEHTEYVHVDIEGHADRRGEESFNLDLSRRRARSILEFLAKHGVEESRLSSEGFGSSRPLVDAQNERAWFMNRRVEFVVTRNREVRVVTGVPGEQQPAFGRDKAPALPPVDPNEMDELEPQDTVQKPAAVEGDQ